MCICEKGKILCTHIYDDVKESRLLRHSAKEGSKASQSNNGHSFGWPQKPEKQEIARAKGLQWKREEKKEEEMSSGAFYRASKRAARRFFLYFRNAILIPELEFGTRQPA